MGRERIPTWATLPVLTWALCLAPASVLADESGDSQFPDCPNADLTATFSKEPIRDQGSTGFCYAEGAAALIDYWRLKRHPERYPGGLGAASTSVVSLAAAYKDNCATDDRWRLDFGSNSGALACMAATPSKGICSQQQFNTMTRQLGLSTLLPGDTHSERDVALIQPSVDYALNNPPDFSGGTLHLQAAGPTNVNVTLMAGGQPISALSGLLLEAGYRCGSAYRPLWESDLRATYQSRYACVLTDAQFARVKGLVEEFQELVNPCDPKKAAGVLDPSANIAGIVDRLNQKACPAGSLVSELAPDGASPPYRTYSSGTWTSTGGVKSRDATKPFSVLEKSLASGVPVTIGLCMGIFHGPKSTGNPNACNEAAAAAPRGGDAAFNAFMQPGMHTVTVVGAQVRDGKCQYLIRNSWGPNCAGFAGCNRGDGTQWLDAADIKKAIVETSYIVPSGSAAPATGAQAMP
jgi:hypothetical protein